MFAWRWADLFAGLVTGRYAMPTEAEASALEAEAAQFGPAWRQRVALGLPLAARCRVQRVALRQARASAIARAALEDVEVEACPD